MTSRSSEGVDHGSSGGAHPRSRVDHPAAMQGHGLFETMRIGADGALPLWDRHLARLRASARVIGLPVPRSDVLQAAAAEALEVAVDAGVLRLTILDVHPEDPEVVIATRPRVEFSAPLRLGLSPATRGRADPSAAHKTTSRMFWRLARIGVPAGTDEVLVAADDGSVLETETGNLFAELDGRWITPPAVGGLLPGVARGLLLEGLQAAGTPALERWLGVDELRRATRIAVTNAVHGPRPAVFEGNSGGGDVDDLEAIWRPAIGEA